MGYVTTWIGETEVEVEDQLVHEYMSFFSCTYDDALWEVACETLELSAMDKIKLIKGE